MAHPPPTKEGQLQATRDTNQKRFACSEKEILAWRNSLIYRYSAITSEHFKAERIDFDNENKQLSLSPWINSSTPTCLAKSVIRLYIKGSKRVTVTLHHTRHGTGTLLCQGPDCNVTVTLYHTRLGTGTLLCQGPDCNELDQTECQLLSNIVADFCHNEDLRSLWSGLVRLPCSFLQNLTGDVQLLTPVPTPRESHVSSTPQLPRNRQSSSHTTIFMTDLASASFDERLMEKTNISNIMWQTDTTKENPDALQTPHPGDYCDATLSAELSSGKNPQLTDVSHTNPPPRYSKRYKRLRRRTLCPKNLFHKSIQEKLHTLQENFENNVSNQTADLETSFIPQLQNTKTATKNELEQHKSHNVDSVITSIREIKCHMIQVEKTIASLSRENHSIKTQIGNLQSDVKRLTKNNTATLCASTQCDIQSVSVDQQIQTTLTGTVHDISKVEEEQDSTSCVIQTHTKTKTDVSLQENNPQPTIVQSTCTSPEAQLSIIKPAPFPDPVNISTPVKNRFYSLSEDKTIEKKNNQQRNLKQNIPTAHTNTPPLNVPTVQQPTEQRTPEQILKDMDISNATTSLLIGNSTIRYINPRLLSSKRDPAFKICIPTLSLPDLTKWLLSLPASIDHIKFLIVHVGVNDCWSGAVPPEAWHNLITLCKPFISMSSISPARGRHHFNSMIAPSNRHLRAACATLKANLIDNHDIFTTASGAPRLALYDGLCDPSRKARARLAVNLKEHILRTYGSELIEDEVPSTPHFTGDLHYRLLRHRWDVNREPLSGSSARVDRRHRRGDIDNKLPSISSTIHFPKLPSRAERSPDFDAKPSAPPVAPGHSACPQQFLDTEDHLLTTPDTRQASVSNTHAQASINAPVSQYPSSTHLPHVTYEHKHPSFQCFLPVRPAAYHQPLQLSRPLPSTLTSESTCNNLPLQHLVDWPYSWF